MRVITTEAYQFDELSETAKEKARTWYREGMFDYEWWDNIYYDVDIIASLLGITIARKDKYTPAIYFSGFASQGDGACFEGSYAWRPGTIESVVAYAPQDTQIHELARRLRDIQEPRDYQLVASVKPHGRYIHSHSMLIDVDRKSNGIYTAGDIVDLTQCLRDFADWIYKRLEEEYNWLSSDTQVDEAILWNEYEFTVDGKPI